MLSFYSVHPLYTSKGVCPLRRVHPLTSTISGKNCLRNSGSNGFLDDSLVTGIDVSMVKGTVCFHFGMWVLWYLKVVESICSKLNECFQIYDDDDDDDDCQEPDSK